MTCNCEGSSGIAPIGFERIVISSTAVTPTASEAGTDALYLGPSNALITVEDNPIRLTYDGTTPTSTIGHYVEAGDSIRVNGSISIQNLKFIRATGADAVAQVTYER